MTAGAAWKGYLSKRDMRPISVRLPDKVRSQLSKRLEKDVAHYSMTTFTIDAIESLLKNGGPPNPLPVYEVAGIKGSTQRLPKDLVRRLDTQLKRRKETSARNTTIIYAIEQALSR